MADMAAPVLAYLLPSGSEMIVILVIGVLLFGRRLPEVGRQVGRIVAEFRRGLEGFKQELNRDESIRDLRTGLRDINRVADVPRKVADPRRLFADLTDPSRTSGAPTVAASAEPVRSDGPGEDPIETRPDSDG